MVGMEEEDSLQEESFQDGQPRRQPRETERRRIPAGIHSREGGEFSISVSQVPPVDPIRPHHLDVFYSIPQGFTRGDEASEGKSYFPKSRNYPSEVITGS